MKPANIEAFNIEMTKQEAAAYLGISERSVNNWIDKGDLNVSYIKGKTRDVADFDEAEVHTLKLKLESRNSEFGKRGARTLNHETLNPESRNIETVNREPRNSESEIVHVPRTLNSETVKLQGFNFQVFSQEQFTELMELQGRVEGVRIVEKPVLTFPEAAEYSGIPEKRLRDAAKNHELKVAKNLGRAAKIQRAELDQWIAQQFK